MPHKKKPPAASPAAAAADDPPPLPAQEEERPSPPGRGVIKAAASLSPVAVAPAKPAPPALPAAAVNARELAQEERQQVPPIAGGIKPPALPASPLPAMAKPAPLPPPPAALAPPQVDEQRAAPAAPGGADDDDAGEEDMPGEARPAHNEPAGQRVARRSLVRMLGDAHAVRYDFFKHAHFLSPPLSPFPFFLHRVPSEALLASPQSTLKERIATRLATFSHTKKRRWIEVVTSFHQELPAELRPEVDLHALKKMVP